MSEAKWTSTPWWVRKHPTLDQCFVAGPRMHPKQPYDTQILGDEDVYYEYEQCLADAERIVACVNACADMRDPAAEIAALREERDRLKAAVEGLRTAARHARATLHLNGHGTFTLDKALKESRDAE